MNHAYVVGAGHHCISPFPSCLCLKIQITCLQECGVLEQGISTMPVKTATALWRPTMECGWKLSWVQTANAGTHGTCSGFSTRWRQVFCHTTSTRWVSSCQLCALSKKLLAWRIINLAESSLSTINPHLQRYIFKFEGQKSGFGTKYVGDIAQKSAKVWNLISF